MSNTVKLKPSEISVPEGRRDIDPETVQSLAESIETTGRMINPITVRRDGEDYVLIVGAHRLEAIRQLGYTEVECIIVDCDDELLFELIEIDENLVRNDITDPIAIGELANRRDKILDAKGLRAKVGDNQHTKRGSADSALPKTTEDIAKEAGIGERVLQVNKQLARDLVPEAKEAFRKKLVTKDTAITISRLEPEKQREIVACGDKKGIIAALREYMPKSKSKQSKNADVPAVAPNSDATSAESEESLDATAKNAVKSKNRVIAGEFDTEKWTCVTSEIRDIVSEFNAASAKYDDASNRLDEIPSLLDSISDLMAREIHDQEYDELQDLYREAKAKITGNIQTTGCSPGTTASTSAPSQQDTRSDIERVEDAMREVFHWLKRAVDSNVDSLTIIKRCRNVGEHIATECSKLARQVEQNNRPDDMKVFFHNEMLLNARDRARDCN